MSEAQSTTIELKNFCGGNRFPKPIVWNGRKYATDGQICVCVDATGERDSADPIGKTIADAIAMPGEITTHSWPPSEFARGVADCIRCEGVGRIERVKCSRCRGTGECACDCGDVHDCCRCSGDGATGGKTCPECEGKQRLIRDITQPVSGRTIDAKYAKLILALPNPRYVDDGTDPNTKLFFVFDGGYGAVMPMLSAVGATS